MTGELGDIRVFDVVLARRIGLTEAIIFAQIDYWLKRSKNKREGRTWVYNTYEAWAEQLPFCERTIRRAIYNLEDMGVLITGNFNTYKGNHTKWYTIEYTHKLLKTSEEDRTIRPEQSDNLSRASGQSVQASPGQSGHIKTETTQESTKQETTNSEFGSSSEFKFSADIKWYESIENWQREIVDDYVETVIANSRDKIRKPEYFRLGIIHNIREGKTPIDITSSGEMAKEMFGV